MITSALFWKSAPESRETTPEFATPSSTEGLECVAQRMTLFGSDFGSTVSPRVKRLPRVVITWSSITSLASLSVRAWMVPNSSET